MKAMILAAGLGTRLYPLTYQKPKAMVEMNGVPLIMHLLKKLAYSGYTDIIINLHHLAYQIVECVNNNNTFGLNITFSDETDCLLDTGGGIKKALWFFNEYEPFIVHNVDIVTEIDLKKIYKFHISEACDATLCVSRRESSRKLIFDSQGFLCGWENQTEKKIIMVREPHGKIEKLSFNGIQMLNKSAFPLSKLSGTFSVINFYLEMAPSITIKAFISNEIVFDVGKPETLEKAAQYFLSHHQ